MASADAGAVGVFWGVSLGDLIGCGWAQPREPTEIDAARAFRGTRDAMVPPVPTIVEAPYVIDELSQSDFCGTF